MSEQKRTAVTATLWNSSTTELLNIKSSSKLEETHLTLVWPTLSSSGPNVLLKMHSTQMRERKPEEIRSYCCSKEMLRRCHLHPISQPHFPPGATSHAGCSDLIHLFKGVQKLEHLPKSEYLVRQTGNKTGKEKKQLKIKRRKGAGDAAKYQRET